MVIRDRAKKSKSFGIDYTRAERSKQRDWLLLYIDVETFRTERLSENSPRIWQMVTRPLEYKKNDMIRRSDNTELIETSKKVMTELSYKN